MPFGASYSWRSAPYVNRHTANGVATSSAATNMNTASWTRGTNRHSPSWSPDGTLIAFSRETANFGQAIFTVASSGTGLTRLTQPSGGLDQYPDWSPDGTTIVYSHQIAGVLSIRTMSPDGTGQAPLLATDEQFPEWQPLP